MTKDHDALVGAIAQERGFVDAPTLIRIQQKQARLSGQGKRYRLVDLLVAEKILTRTQALEILREVHARKGVRRKLGDFEILEKIGEGGMGAVYKARQCTLDRIVALKILPPRLAKDPRLVERFLHEARMSAKLNHPHIVAAIDVGISNGLYYLAMEYLDGKDYAEILRERIRLPEDEVIEIAIQVTKGLCHAAKHHLVHRDLKPANLIRCQDGTVKIADFGLAMAIDPTRAGTWIAHGHGAGTPYYIAPEQAEGRDDLDIRADLYALGATLFEMLTGQKPFQAETAEAIVVQRLQEDPPWVHEINPEISLGFSCVIRRLMARHPEDRYPHPEMLLHDLQQLREGRQPRYATREGLVPFLFAMLSRLRHSVAVRWRRGEEKRFPRMRTMVLLLGGGGVLAGVAFLWVYSRAIRGPCHPDPSKRDQVWAPPAPSHGIGEEARRLWCEARDLHGEWDLTGGKDPELQQRMRAAYETLLDPRFRNTAYAIRAQARLEALNASLKVKEAPPETKEGDGQEGSRSGASE